MRESKTARSFIPYDEQYRLYYEVEPPKEREKQMPKHIVVEAHLLVDDSIQNPHNVAKRAAEKVKEMLVKNYTPKEPRKGKDGKELPPAVTVPVVAHRLSDVADTPE